MFNSIKDFGRTVTRVAVIAACVYAFFWLMSLASLLAGIFIVLIGGGITIHFAIDAIIGNTIKSSLSASRTEAH